MTKPDGPRWKLGAGTMALVTAFAVVAAGGSDADSAAPRPARTDAAWVDTWAPGATETLLDPDAGYKLEPGSLIVLQIRYNLLATDGKPTGSDRSAVRLRLTDGAPRTRELETWSLDAPIDLPCAADESGPLCDRAASIADVTKRSGPEVGRRRWRSVRETRCG